MSDKCGLGAVKIGEKVPKIPGMLASCQVCGSKDWRRLPDPTLGQSITTAGRIVSQALGKAQCGRCGFVQRISGQYLGETDYYEKDYARYYDRPGTRKYHAERYRVLAEWMKSGLRDRKPKRILDAGCGQGRTMEAMRQLYPQAVIEGIDPSHFNCEIARGKGFTIHQGRLGEIGLADRTYDLVFSNNVIQHVMDAARFVADLRSMISPGGMVIITCPDGSIPNIEILWSDQNFSFLPEHLIRLSTGAGFGGIEWMASTPSPSLPPAQMALLSLGVSKREQVVGGIRPPADLDRIYEMKCEYLNSFRKIEEKLLSAIGSSERVCNFGASYWSSILAAYCPRYWAKVEVCLVDTLDDCEGEFVGKPVYQTEWVEPMSSDVIVLGTGPATQEKLFERFRVSWNIVVAWGEFIRY